jgi:diguanylate cyclase (GGDEF)-like protein
VAEDAVSDALTGLSNRRGLARALSALAGNGRPLAILACDLDGFRQVNESLGHEAGDEVLLEVADRLQVMVRGSDCVARLKADHFVVVLPEADLPGALAVGERLVEVVRDPVVTGGGAANLTMCVGLAYTESLGVDPMALVAAADDAVAWRKGSGRDRLVVAG